VFGYVSQNAWRNRLRCGLRALYQDRQDNAPLLRAAYCQLQVPMNHAQRPRIEYLKLVNWPPSAARRPRSALPYKSLTNPTVNSAPGCRSRLPDEPLNVLGDEPNMTYFFDRSCFFEQSDISK
jgi:hypothetical protein